jgi:hypothetical protein
MCAYAKVVIGESREDRATMSHVLLIHFQSDEQTMVYDSLKEKAELLDEAKHNYNVESISFVSSSPGRKTMVEKYVKQEPKPKAPLHNIFSPKVTRSRAQAAIGSDDVKKKLTFLATPRRPTPPGATPRPTRR